MLGGRIPISPVRQFITEPGVLVEYLRHQLRFDNKSGGLIYCMVDHW